MSELFHVFTFPVTLGDTVYRAEVRGRKYTESLWEGWVEFIGPESGRLRSPRETTQPTREALAYWSEGLSPVYLAGALNRAIDAQHSGRALATG